MFKTFLLRKVSGLFLLGNWPQPTPSTARLCELLALDLGPHIVSVTHQAPDLQAETVRVFSEQPDLKSAPWIVFQDPGFEVSDPNLCARATHVLSVGYSELIFPKDIQRIDIAGGYLGACLGISTSGFVKHFLEKGVVPELEMNFYSSLVYVAGSKRLDAGERSPTLADVLRRVPERRRERRLLNALTDSLLPSAALGSLFDLVKPYHGRESLRAHYEQMVQWGRAPHTLSLVSTRALNDLDYEFRLYSEEKKKGIVIRFLSR